jgi:hypothetical protein
MLCWSGEKTEEAASASWDASPGTFAGLKLCLGAGRILAAVTKANYFENL